MILSFKILLSNKALFQAGKNWPIRIVMFLTQAPPPNNAMQFLFVLFLLLPLCGTFSTDFAISCDLETY